MDNIRLELLKSYPHNSLTLKEMKEKGVVATFQGPTKATDVLAELLKELDQNVDKRNFLKEKVR